MGGGPRGLLGLVATPSRPIFPKLAKGCFLIQTKRTQRTHRKNVSSNFKNRRRLRVHPYENSYHPGSGLFPSLAKVRRTATRALTTTRIIEYPIPGSITRSSMALQNVLMGPLWVATNFGLRQTRITPLPLVKEGTQRGPAPRVPAPLL